MLKRITTLLVLALATLFTHAEDQKPRFRAYSPEDKSFEILYPADWKVVPGTAPIVVTFTSQEAKPGQIANTTNLIIVPAPGVTLDALAPVLKTQLAKQPGFKMVDDGALTIGDRKVHRYVYDAKSGDKLPIRGIQFVFVQDDKAYVTNFLMPPDEFKQNEDLALKITGLLKVNGKSALQPAGKTPAEK